MENTYGQFRTVARGAEGVCERWTPLLVRELLCGIKRFNDLHRGVPRMSTRLFDPAGVAVVDWSGRARLVVTAACCRWLSCMRQLL